MSYFNHLAASGAAPLLIKVTVVLAAALALDMLLRRRRVLWCATMWNAALVLLAALPLAAALLPPTTYALPRLPDLAPSEAAPRILYLPVEALEALPLSDARIIPPMPPAAEIPAVPEAAPMPPGADASSASPAAWPRPVELLVVIYLLGCALAIVRLAVGLAAVRRLLERSQPVFDDNWRRRLARCRQSCGIARRVELRSSADASVPVQVGWLRPTVVLPSDLAASASERVGEAVLLHELAHVARNDVAWQFLLQGVQTMLWFHPLFWAAARRIAYIRERACDAFSVHRLGSAEHYISALVSLAGRLTRRRSLSVGLAVLRGSQLGERLEALRDERGNAGCQSSRALRLAACALALTLAGFAGRTAVAEPTIPRQPGLPDDAEALLSDYEATASALQVELQARMAENRGKLEERLQQLQDSYARQAKLDEAVAIRDQLRALRQAAAVRYLDVVQAEARGEAVLRPSMINHRGAIGSVVVMELTGRKDGSIWGTGAYTDDSDVATAAVHAGVLEPSETGMVKVTMLKGESKYYGSLRNGVQSADWDNANLTYSGFKVERASSGDATFHFISPANQPAATPEHWFPVTDVRVDRPQPRLPDILPDPGTLYGFRGKLDTPLLFTVRADPSGTVFGTDVYTDDSPLCTAVVHAGLLQPGESGIVRVKMLPGQKSYEASRRNGVDSQPWGQWGGSYQVELLIAISHDVQNMGGIGSTVNSRMTPAETFRASTVDMLTRTGPPESPMTSQALVGPEELTVAANIVNTVVVGSTTGVVWGTGIYTADSDPATAAVHAGILRPGEQGIVRIIKLPGLPSYSGSQLNGVTSRSYGPWDSSFTFLRNPPSREPQRK